MAQARGYCQPVIQEEACRDFGKPTSRGEPTPRPTRLLPRSVGYRLIYQVIDQEDVVFVVAVDKRENDAAYRWTEARLKPMRGNLRLRFSRHL